MADRVQKSQSADVKVIAEQFTKKMVAVEEDVYQARIAVDARVLQRAIEQLPRRPNEWMALRSSASPGCSPISISREPRFLPAA